MSLWDLVTNTVEGVAQTTVNGAKLIVSPLAAPFDEGKAMGDAAKGVADGVEKIGKADKSP